MPLELTYRAGETLPVELEGLTPDALRGDSLDDVRGRRAYVGNTTVAVGELFDVAGTTEDAGWRVAGDLAAVHYLGAGMSGGRIEVTGNVGRHAGAQMRGGELIVHGGASDWLGAEMRGGRIEVTGDAGDLVGAAYRGSPRGMRGGQILVRGSAGAEAGAAMRRGWITVAGDCGQLAGYRMRAGTLFVLGACGRRPGAEMIRGTIGLFGPAPPLLPTFRHACKIAPQLLGVLSRQLAPLGLAVPTEVNLYNGDLLTGGRGEILIRG